MDKIRQKTVARTWTAFQQKLIAFQAKLHEIDQQCDVDPTKTLHPFSGENYNVLIGEFNAFIEAFEMDPDLQVAKLQGYVYQKRLSNVWRNLMNAGVRSIAELPPSEKTCEKLLRMGE